MVKFGRGSGVFGIHHVTAIARNPPCNIDFYTGLLGLRLVKQTVNFDDPTTYHLYYGDSIGRPGSILTFFPWSEAPRGYRGTGQVTAIYFLVPAGSINNYWTGRLSAEAFHLWALQVALAMNSYHFMIPMD